MFPFVVSAKDKAKEIQAYRRRANQSGAGTEDLGDEPEFNPNEAIIWDIMGKSPNFAGVLTADDGQSPVLKLDEITGIGKKQK